MTTGEIKKGASLSIQFAPGEPFERLGQVKDIKLPKFHFRHRFGVMDLPRFTYYGTCTVGRPDHGGDRVRRVAHLLDVPLSDALAAFGDYFGKFPGTSHGDATLAFLAEAQAFGAMPVGRPLWAAQLAWPMPEWPPVFRGSVVFWSFVLTLLILLGVMA